MASKPEGATSPLTPKQAAFVQEYLKDLNATQAAIRAGYSAKTANEQGARLLVNVSIKTEIDKALAKRAEKAQITAQDVLNELTLIAQADITELFKLSTDGKRLAFKSLDDIPPEARRLIKKIRIKGDLVEVDFWDKMRALELCGKHLGMFREETLLPPAPGEKKSQILETLEGMSSDIWADEGPIDEG